MYLWRKKKSTNEKYTVSSSIYFMSIFLLFKFFCISLVKLCSFTILKAFLTQFWQLVFVVSNSQPNFLWVLWQNDNLLWVGFVTVNLIREFSNVPMLFFVYIVSLLLFLAGHTWLLEIFSSVFFETRNCLEALANGLLLWHQIYICLN